MRHKGWLLYYVRLRCSAADSQMQLIRCEGTKAQESRGVVCLGYGGEIVGVVRGTSPHGNSCHSGTAVRFTNRACDLPIMLCYDKIALSGHLEP